MKVFLVASAVLAVCIPNTALRDSAGTDCNDTPYSLNGSLYWQPALVHQDG